MEMENEYLLMKQFINNSKVNLKIIYHMDLEKHPLKMEIFIKDILKMEIYQERENIYIKNKKKVIFISEIF